MIAAPPLAYMIDNSAIDYSAISIHRYLVAYGKSIGCSIEHLCKGLLRYIKEKKDD